MASEIGALIEYRTFRNTDPPKLAEIWRSQPTSRGLMQPMSTAIFDRYVLAKPTFDRRGLIVAVDEGGVVGFAHAGFGPNEDGSRLSFDRGVTCLVMLRPDVDRSVASELLTRAEAYLIEKGAKKLYGGGGYPLAPFYYGLYGGSEPSGVLDSDPEQQAIFTSAGYRAARRTIVLNRDLAGFRPVVDRQQMQIRRTTRLEMSADPPPANWWESVMFEPFERTRWALVERDSGTLLASLYGCHLETMIGAWGVRAMGVVDVEVPDERRRRGLATNLLGEVFRHMHAQGFTLAEAHVREENAPGLAVFRNLGFHQVDASTLYCKD